MAIINQSPAGQESVTLAGIDPVSLLIATSLSPVRQSTRKQAYPTATNLNPYKNFRGTILMVSHRLIGKDVPVSLTYASGIFGLKAHASAKRAGVWPNRPVD